MHPTRCRPPDRSRFHPLGSVHPRRLVTFLLGLTAGLPSVLGSWHTRPIRHGEGLMLSRRQWRLQRPARIDPPRPHRIKGEIMSCNCRKGDLNPALSKTAGRREMPGGGRAATGTARILGRC